VIVLYRRELRTMTLRKTIKTVNSQTQIENTGEGLYCKILLLLTFVIKYFVLVITNINKIAETLRHFTSVRKIVESDYLASSCLSVCSSVLMEQLGCHWKRIFREI